MHEDIWSLDLETSKTDKGQSQFALEPFRVRQGLAKVTSLSSAGPEQWVRTIVNTDEIPEIIRFHRNHTVYCHNAVFDIAWAIMYTPFEDIVKVQWRDTMLLAKWLMNAQETDLGNFSYSLANLVKTFLPDHPMTETFLAMKGEHHEAGEDEAYWLQRGDMDAIITRDLAIELERRLPESQRRGYIIEQKCLPYVARAWVLGIPFDKEYVESLIPKIDAFQRKISNEIGVTESQIKSASQLSGILFNERGYEPISRGKTGKGSTAAGDLKLIAYNYADTEKGAFIKKILDFKQLATLKSKYINGLINVANYVGESVCYPAPRMYSTYTGRFTYASKTLKKDAFQVSIATHQLPRKGPTKKALGPHFGQRVGRYDAAQQELRLVGEISLDHNLITGFNAGLDLHSDMSAFISGRSYTEFCDLLAVEDPEALNYRYAGKLLNLSCQYRIGYKALKQKFFETYGIVISDMQARQYLNFYKRRYPGVVEYWDTAIDMARRAGYAETLAGRRYGISEWSGQSWKSESSAINTPIQGSAADHKEATLWQVSEKFPEINFILDVHDELNFFGPDEDEIYPEVLRFMNTIDYEALWDKELHVKLPFDGVVGMNFKEGDKIHV